MQFSRRDAARSNNNSRLVTIKGQVKSIVNRIMDIEKLLQDYEEDLSIAEGEVNQYQLCAREIIAAKERILEQNLSEIDNRISLSKLMSELLYLHGLYPYILSIEELSKAINETKLVCSLSDFTEGLLYTSHCCFCVYKYFCWLHHYT